MRPGWNLNNFLPSLRTETDWPFLQDLLRGCYIQGSFSLSIAFLYFIGKGCALHELEVPLCVGLLTLASDSWNIECNKVMWNINFTGFVRQCLPQTWFRASVDSPWQGWCFKDGGSCIIVGVKGLVHLD